MYKRQAFKWLYKGDFKKDPVAFPLNQTTKLGVGDMRDIGVYTLLVGLMSLIGYVFLLFYEGDDCLLYTSGKLPEYNEYDTAAAEADSIIKQAAVKAEKGFGYKNQAVLYRTNAQSRLLEEKCISRSVPYIICLLYTSRCV